MIGLNSGYTYGAGFDADLKEYARGEGLDCWRGLLGQLKRARCPKPGRFRTQASQRRGCYCAGWSGCLGK